MLSGAQNAPVADGSTDPAVQEFYDLQKDYSEISADAGATSNEIESLNREQAQHERAMNVADSEGRGAKNTYEGMTRQLDAFKRQAGEGEGQLRLFAGQIEKKVELREFYDYWASKSCVDHYINWLAISIGETENNGRKIMARIFKIMMRDGSALRGASTPTMNVAPLELGGLATVSPFPTEMYQRALQTGKDLESDYVKYDGEVERLNKKEGDIVEDLAKANAEGVKAGNKLSDADREKMLSEGLRAQLVAQRSKLDGRRDELRSIEARMNAIKREKGADPTQGRG